ncbi:glycosyltransferase family 4 protein [Flavobacteriaceae bacterium F89]|uniref:Glycosyltransferase family 4 protein n=1 Tax=Cerina litoralis TaxID=2874477 RepID=A0AAE3EWX3_9FLAO|nr:glycosyltransferase family 4 protein [Cerina litoralis]MCG2461181.1 glycosyltransferase family 4 protein [Cerina litoralis]
MQKKRILIICSASYSLTNFRGDLIKSLIDNDYEVYAAAPNFRKDVAEILKKVGAIPIEFELQRTGLNPFKDVRTIFQLKKIIKENQIDLIFPYTIKPVIYGSMAANSVKVPVISLITGLGFTFSAASQKARMLQKVTEFLYRISIRKNKVIIFQNSDDHQLFLDNGIISKDNKIDIVGGSGVNLNQFAFRVNENLSDKIRFLLIARLIEEKGVQLYLDAALYLKAKYPLAEFHVIGAPDNSPSAVKQESLDKLHKDGIIVCHGEQENIAEHLTKGDVFVLPTYYREGVPRSILEALSVGLPIITTDSPGCKETVISQVNGILIKPKNLEELVSAMGYFLTHKKEIKRMGIESRKYAEEKFDVNLINRNIIKSFKSVLN